MLIFNIDGIEIVLLFIQVLKKRREYHNRTENKYLLELDDNAHDDDIDKVTLGINYCTCYSF